MTQPPAGPPAGPPSSSPGGATGSPRASHRGRRKASSVALPIVLALALAVVGFIVVWVWIGLGSDSDTETALPPAGDPATTSVSETPSPTTSSPSPTSTSASPKPTKTDKPEPTKTQKPEPARNVPVVVFNQTTTPGLAARFAARLEIAGWNVVGVDNWFGTVPATTVYYPPGDEDAAKALRADFPDVGRIRPRLSNMPTDSLTVILTTDFPTG